MCLSRLVRTIFREAILRGEQQLFFLSFLPKYVRTARVYLSPIFLDSLRVHGYNKTIHSAAREIRVYGSTTIVVVVVVHPTSM